ncbi:MAG TPA: hypothetical protein VGD97_00180 [Lacunisphaera sp.]
MTTIHAYAFLALGGLLNLLPLLAPAHFPPNSLDGANTSALWLQFMGWVNGGLGAGYAARLQVLPAVAQVLAWRPALPPEIQPAQILRPAMDLYAEIESLADERERGAA